MRVIVCGGRTYSDRETFAMALDAFHRDRPFTLVLHGGANGADSLAHQWAANRKIPTTIFPADWKTYGKSAGPIRNQKMADHGADLCIAFHGGAGTADMVKRAKKARIPVQVVAGDLIIGGGLSR